MERIYVIIIVIFHTTCGCYRCRRSWWMRVKGRTLCVPFCKCFACVWRKMVTDGWARYFIWRFNALQVVQMVHFFTCQKHCVTYHSSPTPAPPRDCQRNSPVSKQCQCDNDSSLMNAIASEIIAFAPSKDTWMCMESSGSIPFVRAKKTSYIFIHC